MSFEADIEGLDEEPLVDRKETAVRAVLTLLFWIVLRVAMVVIGVIVIFELLVTLVTRRPPAPGVRRFANQTLSYVYRTLRYITYNEDDAPFPFRELPEEVERVDAEPRADQRS